ncbi:MAG TPA: hypothetical protein VFG10_14920 [Saprospiraceae bacterium]|nr:hypothetical protein [Saprospiraceae bacterium]
MKYILFIILSMITDYCSAQYISTTEIDSLIAGIKKTLLENYVITDKAKLISDSLDAADYFAFNQISIYHQSKRLIKQLKS